ncbi:unnamed protein product [Durusdinium trenchii]|uniref:Uncharacterized protein n=1 Tax=Durusdinium trenchii TaxID=1381693 RepID=A0ABP0NNC0_9DINO
MNLAPGNLPSSRTVMFNREIDVQNLKELQDLPEKRREGRAQEIRSGVNFLQRAPRFPANRRCVDLPWVILFFAHRACTHCVQCHFHRRPPKNSPQSPQSPGFWRSRVTWMDMNQCSMWMTALEGLLIHPMTRPSRQEMELHSSEMAQTGLRIFTCQSLKQSISSLQCLWQVLPVLLVA